MKTVLTVTSCTSGSLAVLMDLGPTVSCTVATGPSLNPQDLRADAFDTALRSLLAKACGEVVHLDVRRRADCAVFAIDGVYGRPEQTLVDETLSVSPIACERVSHIDRGKAALLAAPQFEHGETVYLHAGTTGFAACTRPTSSVVDRHGGYGPFSGDDGAAYFIGRRLLYRVLAEIDQGSSSEFVSKVRALARWTDRYDPLRWIRRSHPLLGVWTQIADLARIVVELGRDGDIAALGLLGEGAARLAEIASGLAQRDLHGQAVRIVLAGGLAQHSSAYVRALRRAVTARFGEDVEMSPLRLHPSVGCLRAALELIDEHSAVWPTLLPILAADPRMTINFDDEVLRECLDR